MNLHDIRAGEEIRLGTTRGYRLWRYSLWYRPIVLVSWALDCVWNPIEGCYEVSELGHRGGVYSYKTRELRDVAIIGIGEAERCARTQHNCLVCDGVIFGEVELWGRIVEHERMYRAQYARPVIFEAAHGKQAVRALESLRRQWRV